MTTRGAAMAEGSGRWPVVTIKSCTRRTRPTTGPTSTVEAPPSPAARAEPTADPLVPALVPARPQLLVFCARCDQHHVAMRFEREDDTEWIVDRGACRASFVAPVVGAAAADPIVQAGVRLRLEHSLQPLEPIARRAPSEHDVEVDAWTAAPR